MMRALLIATTLAQSLSFGLSGREPFVGATRGCRAKRVTCLFEDEAKILTIRTPTGIILEAVDEYSTDSGAIIRRVEPGSNADRKGVYAGYVLMEVNGVDMSHASMPQIEDAIGTEPGNLVNLRFRPHATTAEAFGWGANSMQ